MCEFDPLARSVLAKHFPDVEIRRDVRRMKSLPACDLLAAGWPCQDLSQAGRMNGISGSQSGLIGEVFRLLHATRKKPPFIILENVAFALHLQNGQALSFVTNELEKLGYSWAYRILDSRHFGLPQRRRRLFVVASRDRKPADILFDTCEEDSSSWPKKGNYTGFYWTEGNTGIGWSPGAIPPLKGGSGLSIPSPPAVWQIETRDFVVPGIGDAERMQGFPRGWTNDRAMSAKEQRSRWRLVGNAVSVPVAQWLGNRLLNENDFEYQPSKSTRSSNAGFGGPNLRKQTVWIPEGPLDLKHRTLDNFKLLGPRPLSLRAAKGFYDRVSKSTLKVDANFVRDLQAYTL